MSQHWEDHSIAAEDLLAKSREPNRTDRDRMVASAQVEATLAVAWAINTLIGYLMERDGN